MWGGVPRFLQAPAFCRRIMFGGLGSGLLLSKTTIPKHVDAERMILGCDASTSPHAHPAILHLCQFTRCRAETDARCGTRPSNGMTMDQDRCA